MSTTLASKSAVRTRKATGKAADPKPRFAAAVEGPTPLLIISEPSTTTDKTELKRQAGMAIMTLASTTIPTATPEASAAESAGGQ